MLTWYKERELAGYTSGYGYISKTLTESDDKHRRQQAREEKHIRSRGPPTQGNPIEKVNKITCKSLSDHVQDISEHTRCIDRLGLQTVQYGQGY
eukprot:767958-Hanusia_phi.AAC.10